MPAAEAKPSAPPVLTSKRITGSHERAGDRAFRRLVAGFGWVVIVLAALMALELYMGSRTVWAKFGLGFLWTSAWDPVADKFGALPFIYGTLVTSAVALLVALPLGVGSAVFLAELAPRKVSDVCSFLIELLAAVPSVILGLMGIFILVPAVRSIEPSLIKYLGFLPLFRGVPYGVGLLTAGLILALMILPYITVITREVLLQVPGSLKEAMLALGATRWEMVWGVSLPYARPGIVGAVFLSLGRALGETMAVTMVIGNTPKISASLLEPSYTMAAVIANELAEAVGDLHLASLVAIGLTLFAITVVINGAARLMLYRLTEAGK